MFNEKDRTWKILMFLPIIAMLISASFLLYKQVATGEMIHRDIELSGGKQITVEVVTSMYSKDIASALEQKGFAARVNILAGLKTTLLIETSFTTNADDLVAVLRSISGITLLGEPSIREIGPKLSEQFFQQAQWAVVLAFVFMSIIVFLLFRMLLPSLFVILCAFTDIVITFAALSFFDIPLSLSMLAALLMLIGYSVDTDILLMSRTTKRLEDPIKVRIKSAVKTGLTMSFTTIAALLALYFISGNADLQTIAFVLLIGLLVDMPSTWLTNAGLMRWYMIRKHGSEEENK